ncbi:MAG: hypothetical protein JO165_11260 [Candidatus Eremiobacteraeota bacterium]|nr:hypothetical protein [Candidatus Eremiobacteraeota bacterium]
MSHALRAQVADITPRDAEPLFGFVSRRGPHDRVHDRLEINGALLSCGENRALFLSFDLLYVGPTVTDSLKAYCNERYELPGSAVFLSASHTHFAPSTDETKPMLGKASATYIEEVDGRAKRLIDELFARTQRKVELRTQRSTIGAAVNRRLPRWTIGPPRGLQRTVVIAPNPHGPFDPDIHVLAARDEEGKLAAVFWNYACHPVAFPRPTLVSSEFAGRVRDAIRSYADAEIPVIFWQGFSGDVRPRVLQARLSARARLRNLLRGPSFGTFAYEEWEVWTASIAERVIYALEATRSATPISGDISTRSCTMPLTELFSKPNRIRELEFQRIDIGDTLTVFGASAELVTEYIWRTRNRLDRKTVICVGCVGPVYGYFPTARQIAEGGYESDEFRAHFSISGRFAASPETVLERALNLLS